MLSINNKYKKIISIAVLSAIALCSIFIFSKFATNPENYKSTIQSINAKKLTVTGVTASAVTISAFISAIPGEVATPIAEQIMNISSYLVIVVCVLMLEKSLLTVMGYLSFKILIPISCLLFGIYTFIKKEFLRTLAVKVIIFSIVIVTVIPLSVKIGDMVYEVNSVSIEQLANTAVESETKFHNESDTQSQNMLDKLKNSISDIGNYAKQKLNQFMDVIAIFLISYCIIPIMVLLFTLWFFKFLFGFKKS